VVDSIAAGRIFQSDADFLFGDVLSAVVREALGKEQANKPRLTPLGARLRDWTTELLQPIVVDAATSATAASTGAAAAAAARGGRYYGGTDMLLHGQCRSLDYLDQAGRTCEAFATNPALCSRLKVEGCSGPMAARQRYPQCDRLSGKSHVESCCACGGGRTYVDHRRTATATNSSSEATVQVGAKRARAIQHPGRFARRRHRRRRRRRRRRHTSTH
jgi:hypothetical protein